MASLLFENLQEFCRICLKSLRADDEVTRSRPADNDALSYNIYYMPNLKKLMVLALNIEMENEVYPQSVCGICYYKLLDLHEFRDLALRSGQILHVFVNRDKVASTDARTSKHTDGDDNAQQKNTSCNNTSEQHNALVNVKCELIDDDMCETAADTIAAALPTGAANSDSEFEAENEHQKDSENGYGYYKNRSGNALADDSDTIADDADDEEHALPNGAANASSVALNNSMNNNFNQDAVADNETSSGGGKRRRDRSKKMLKCPRCDKQAYKQVYLDAHIRAVHEGHAKPFICQADECAKAFTRFNQLNVHIQANHLQLQQKFACEYDGCDATFRLSNTLETHRQVAHATAAAPFSIDDVQALLAHEAQLSRESDVAQELICHLCERKYSTKRTLSEHLKRHAQIKEHVCEVCGCAKVTRTELQTHMRTHDRQLEKFPCPQCPQAFNHKNAITRHVRVVHEGQRRFNCRYCARRFGTRNSQVCHERLHTGERPYSCQHCDKSFAQLEGLKLHLQNHDKNLRKHVCRVCAQRFTTPKSLFDHETRHRGENNKLEAHQRTSDGAANAIDSADDDNGAPSEADGAND